VFLDFLSVAGFSFFSFLPRFIDIAAWLAGPAEV
jgi:hypothetical protein